MEGWIGIMKIFFRLLTFLVLASVFGVVLWCALAPSPDLVNIKWMPQWIGKWANANPTFRNFPAFGILAMGFYAAGFAWFDPRQGAGHCALAFIASVTAAFAGVAMEVAQLRLPGRFFDPDDISWSMAGALTGAFVAWLAGLFLIRES
jgi:hypothetical protein